MNLNIKTIINATGGKCLQGPDLLKVRHVIIDSRLVRPGDIFVCIKGHRLDGHKFIEQAISRGAKAVLISRPVKVMTPGITFIRVADTAKALGHIARVYREQFPIPIVAITGSAGKTTTKEMIVSVLRSEYKVLANKGTENNHIGVPLTLLKLKPRHEIAVIELGTNQPGDIAWLTSLVQPTVAVMTNIGESHLEKLKDVQNVFNEKYNLVKGLSRKGAVIYNADDKILRRVSGRRKEIKKLTFGLTNKADFKAGHIRMNGHAGLQFIVNRKISVQLKTPVFSSIYNALAAISCGRFFGISYNIIINKIINCSAANHRQEIKKHGAFWLIDDSYNANPVSFRSALETLARLPIKGRRILIAADMLELGKDSGRLHVLVGRKAADARMDYILTYGRKARFFIQGARKINRDIHAFHFIDRMDMHRKLVEICRPGDGILVKGSRAMHMEHTVEFLKTKIFK